MSKELFKEAIADAKAVREAALANAKAALEEALTPKLQSMLAAKLQEIEEIDEAKEEEMDEAKKKSEEEKMEEGYVAVDGTNPNTDFSLEEEKEEDLEEDFDLSEILAELNDEKELDEAKEEDKKEKMDEAEEEEEEEEEESEEGEEEEVEVKDMTIDDLKDLIKDIISQEMDTEMPADEEEIVPVDAMSGEMGPDLGAEVEEDEIDLEELLAELDSLDEADDKEEMDEAKKKEDKKEKMNEGKIGDFFNKIFGTKCLKEYNAAIKAGENEKTAFAKFSKCMEATTGGTVTSGTGPVVGGFGQSGATSADVYESEELAEAIETINTLRSELNEVNLLNAKLLYVNKLFKAKNLTESQKLKVIASFDKATNVKEAKVVFESLQSALTAAPKNQIKESLGFASKAVGVAPNKMIVESNDVIARMQKLANIK